jgi:quercetin dioxygenase-like cupin family protein
MTSQASIDESRRERGTLEMGTKHTYLKTHTLTGAVLSFAVGLEDAALRERASTTRSGRAAKTLVKDGPLRITLIVLRKGAALSPHQVDGVLSIQVLRGRVRVSAEGAVVDLSSNGLLVLDQEVAHTAEALADCALLITVAMTPGAA